MLLPVDLTHPGKFKESFIVKVVLNAQMVTVPMRRRQREVGLRNTANRKEQKNLTYKIKGSPGKVVPFIHINTIPLVGYDLIEEGLVFRSAFVRPLQKQEENQNEKVTLNNCSTLSSNQFDSKQQKQRPGQI